MSRTSWLGIACGTAGLVAAACWGRIVQDAAAQTPAQQTPRVRLIVRGDDIGSSHAANVACIKAYKDGIVRTVEVMVPGPWFAEAARLLRENPGLDVGVHLTLTSEWENIKWGPLTHAPSLVDGLGYFHPMTSQRADFPPGTGFLECGFRLEEVEAELRAQIETARKHIPRVSHLTAHMWTACATPQLRALTERLAQEYKLPLELPRDVRPAGGFGGPDTTAGQKEAALVRILENLEPGNWLFVDHPGLDTPEMQAIGHKGYENVAADRDGVTRALCSPKAMEVVQRRGIELLSYAGFYRGPQAVGPAARP